MTEPTLWDLPDPDPMHRAKDPETSRAAAHSVNRNHREQEVLDALRLLGVASSTHDIQKCLEGYGIRRDRNCLSRRLTTLVRDGRVDARGVKPGPHGRQVTAYRIRAGLA